MGLQGSVTYTEVYMELNLLSSGGYLGQFCWVCATGLSEPLAHYGLFWGQF